MLRLGRRNTQKHAAPNKPKVIAAGSGIAANTPTDCVAHVPMGPGSKYGVELYHKMKKEFLWSAGRE
jgi:hypothetical protein